ncbi:SRPBCC family protein [Kitasatospora sp. NPDC059327]|uniref:SRPBCC family protein n=1 Tax=Kitasatospora sp. NPDC059327 TaxID=3346803 RepID=UPI0036792918
MITVERAVVVARPADEVIAYLADFANTVDWDPGTVSCTRLDEGPVTTGAVWHNVSVFRGRRTELTYVLDRYEDDRLVFVGRNRAVTARDEITVHPRGDDGAGSLLLYRARLWPRGLVRLAAPLLRREFESLADRTAQRLPVVLARI